MKILIGKLGKSTFFDEGRQGYMNGDEEAPNMYRLLASRHPEHEFYFIGRSDITKTRSKNSGPSLYDEESEVNIPSNIIDMFEDVPKKLTTDVHVWLEEKIKKQKLKFDLGIIYQGPAGCVNIPNVGTPRIDGAGAAKSLEMFQNYTAPILHVLNQTNVPYISICGDPKYIPAKGRDITNDEKVVLSQINCVHTPKRLKDFKTFETRSDPIEYVYGSVETIFMLNEKKIDWRNISKTNQFVIGLHGGHSRDDFARDWLLKFDNLDSLKVYGKWSEEFTDKYPQIFEDKSIKSVESVFLNTRYTLIPPPHQLTSNFVTQKFWKMLHYGIIPFFHPKYDTDKLLNVPKLLRIQTPEEMWERIEYLDKNPEAYQKIKDKLWAMLDDGYYNGDFLHNKVNETLKQYIGFTL